MDHTGLSWRITRRMVRLKIDFGRNRDVELMGTRRIGFGKK